MEEREPAATFTFRSSDGTVYEIPVRTAAEAEQMFRAAQEIAGRLAVDSGAGAEGYALPAAQAALLRGGGQGAGAGAATPVAAECGFDCDAAAADAADAAASAAGDIDEAIDILVAEGVPREDTMREPWITFVPRRLGWRDALGDSPDRLCVRGIDHYILQGAPGTIIIDERAACVVPGGILLHPSVVFHCPSPRCGHPPHALDLDGPWYGTRAGAGATRARRKAYNAAGLPAITVSTCEHPLGTWTGILQKSIRRHLRPGPRRSRR